MARVSEAFLSQYQKSHWNEYEKPCVVVVDMINGFVKDGALADAKISEIAPAIAKLLEKQVPHVFVADTHVEDALEFEAYPKHCLAGSVESEVMDELKPYVSELIEKNSTCTFTSPNWKAYYETHQDEFETFVLVGCCSDICILQFALALRAYFNEHNIPKRIVIPISMIDTYHIEGVHDVVSCNEFAICNMAGNAIEIVSDFIYE